MKALPIILTSVFLLISGNSQAGAIDELNMGLSKTSVFSTPTPKPFHYSQVKEGEAEALLPRYWEGAPPQITHRVDEYLPISAEENQCTDCHDQYRKIGRRQWHKGVKKPMSKSHYGGFYGTGAKDAISGARYNCMQCHVPQADTPPLVQNTLR